MIPKKPMTSSPEMEIPAPMKKQPMLNDKMAMAKKKKKGVSSIDDLKALAKASMKKGY